MARKNYCHDLTPLIKQVNDILPQFSAKQVTDMLLANKLDVPNTIDSLFALEQADAEDGARECDDMSFASSSVASPPFSPPNLSMCPLQNSRALSTLQSASQSSAPPPCKPQHTYDRQQELDLRIPQRYNSDDKAYMSDDGDHAWHGEMYGGDEGDHDKRNDIRLAGGARELDATDENVAHIPNAQAGLPTDPSTSHIKAELGVWEASRTSAASGRGTDDGTGADGGTYHAAWENDGAWGANGTARDNEWERDRQWHYDAEPESTEWAVHAPWQGTGYGDKKGNTVPGGVDHARAPKHKNTSWTTEEQWERNASRDSAPAARVKEYDTEPDCETRRSTRENDEFRVATENEWWRTVDNEWARDAEWHHDAEPGPTERTTWWSNHYHDENSDSARTKENTCALQQNSNNWWSEDEPWVEDKESAKNDGNAQEKTEDSSSEWSGTSEATKTQDEDDDCHSGRSRTKWINKYKQDISQHAPATSLVWGPANNTTSSPMARHRIQAPGNLSCASVSATANPPLRSKAALFPSHNRASLPVHTTLTNPPLRSKALPVSPMPERSLTEAQVLSLHKALSASPMPERSLTKAQVLSLHKALSASPMQERSLTKAQVVSLCNELVANAQSSGVDKNPYSVIDDLCVRMGISDFRSLGVGPPESFAPLAPLFHPNARTQSTQLARVEDVAKKVIATFLAKEHGVTFARAVSAIVKEMGVSDFKQLRVGTPFQVHTLKDLAHRESDFITILTSYKAVRTFTSLCDFEEYVVRYFAQDNPHVSTFADLRLGPLLASDAVRREFAVPADMTTAPTVTARAMVDAFIRAMNARFRKKLGEGRGLVEVNDFLRVLCADFHVQDATELCVSVNNRNFGRYVRAVNKATASEKEELERLTREALTVVCGDAARAFEERKNRCVKKQKAVALMEQMENTFARFILDAPDALEEQCRMLRVSLGATSLTDPTVFTVFVSCFVQYIVLKNRVSESTAGVVGAALACPGGTAVNAPSVVASCDLAAALELEETDGEEERSLVEYLAACEQTLCRKFQVHDFALFGHGSFVRWVEQDPHAEMLRARCRKGSANMRSHAAHQSGTKAPPQCGTSRNDHVVDTAAAFLLHATVAPSWQLLVDLETHLLSRYDASQWSELPSSSTSFVGFLQEHNATLRSRVDCDICDVGATAARRAARVPLPILAAFVRRIPVGAWGRALRSQFGVHNVADLGYGSLLALRTQVEHSTDARAVFFAALIPNHAYCASADTLLLREEEEKNDENTDNWVEYNTLDIAYAARVAKCLAPDADAVVTLLSNVAHRARADDVATALQWNALFAPTYGTLSDFAVAHGRLLEGANVTLLHCADEVFYAVRPSDASVTTVCDAIHEKNGQRAGMLLGAMAVRHVAEGLPLDLLKSYLSAAFAPHLDDPAWTHMACDFVVGMPIDALCGARIFERVVDPALRAILPDWTARVAASIPTYSRCAQLFRVALRLRVTAWVEACVRELTAERSDAHDLGNPASTTREALVRQQHHQKQMQAPEKQRQQHHPAQEQADAGARMRETGLAVELLNAQHRNEPAVETTNDGDVLACTPEQSGCESCVVTTRHALATHAGTILGAPTASCPKHDKMSPQEIVVNDIRARWLPNVRPDDEDLQAVFDNHQKTISRALELLSDDLYDKDFHFIFELLQNADDNEYVSGIVPTVTFVLRPEGTIVVRNNERGFHEENVRALCAVRQSTKACRDGLIGRKGIGFKAVFSLCDRPEVHSNGYHFCFRKSDSPIGMILPIWLTEDDTKEEHKQDDDDEACSNEEEGDKEEKHEEDDDDEADGKEEEGDKEEEHELDNDDETDGKDDEGDMKGKGQDNGLMRWTGHKSTETRIVLPGIEPSYLMKCATEWDAIDGMLLLFLRRLRRIKIRDLLAHTTRTFTRRDFRSLEATPNCTLLEITRTEDAQAPTTSRFLVINQGLDVPTHMLSLKAATTVEVAFALPECGGNEDEDDNSCGDELARTFPVYSYLPLAHRGFKFALQCDWDVTAARDHVHEDKEWNQWLRQECSAVVLAGVRGLLECVDSGIIRDCGYPLAVLLNSKDDVDKFFAPIVHAIMSSLRRERFVRTACGQWVLPTQCVAPTDFAADELEALITPQMLMDGCGRYYVHQHVRRALKRSPTVARDLGFHEVDARTLVPILAQLDKADVLRTQDVSWVRSVLWVLYKVWDSRKSDEEHCAFTREIKQVRLLPLVDGRYVAAGSACVFFALPADTSTALYAFERTFNVLTPNLTRCSDEKNPLIIAMLRRLGACDQTEVSVLSYIHERLTHTREGADPFTPAEVFSVAHWLVDHPPLKNKQHEFDAVVRALPLLCVEHEDDDAHSSAGTRIVDADPTIDGVVWPPPRGMRYTFRVPAHPPSSTYRPVHIHPDYGLPDIAHEFRRVAKYDTRWTYIHPAYLSRAASNEQWLPFLELWGAVRFLHIVERVYAFPNAGDVDAKPPLLLGELRSAGMSQTACTVTDYEAPLLDELLQFRRMEASPCVVEEDRAQCAWVVAQYLREANIPKHAIIRDEFKAERAEKALLMDGPKQQKVNIRSSVQLLLECTWWLADASRVLRRPCELYFDTPSIRDLLATHVRYLPKQLDVGSCEHLSDLGVAHTVSLNKMMALLDTWSQDMFYTTPIHMAAVYEFIKSTLDWRADTLTLEMLRTHCVIWVPVERVRSKDKKECHKVRCGEWKRATECFLHDRKDGIDLETVGVSYRFLEAHYHEPLASFFCSLGAQYHPPPNILAEIYAALGKNKSWATAKPAIIGWLTKECARGPLKPELAAALRTQRIWPTHVRTWVSLAEVTLYIDDVLPDDADLTLPPSSADHADIVLLGGGARKANRDGSHSKLASILTRLGVPLLSSVTTSTIEESTMGLTDIAAALPVALKLCADILWSLLVRGLQIALQDPFDGVGQEEYDHVAHFACTSVCHAEFAVRYIRDMRITFVLTHHNAHPLATASSCVHKNFYDAASHCLYVTCRQQDEDIQTLGDALVVALERMFTPHVDAGNQLPSALLHRIVECAIHELRPVAMAQQATLIDDAHRALALLKANMTLGAIIAHERENDPPWGRSPQDILVDAESLFAAGTDNIDDDYAAKEDPKDDVKDEEGPSSDGGELTALVGDGNAETVRAKQQCTEENQQPRRPPREIESWPPVKPSWGSAPSTRDTFSSRGAPPSGAVSQVWPSRYENTERWHANAAPRGSLRDVATPMRAGYRNDPRRLSSRRECDVVRGESEEQGEYAHAWREEGPPGELSGEEKAGDGGGQYWTERCKGGREQHNGQRTQQRKGQGHNASSEGQHDGDVSRQGGKELQREKAAGGKEDAAEGTNRVNAQHTTHDGEGQIAQNDGEAGGRGDRSFADTKTISALTFSKKNDKENKYMDQLGTKVYYRRDMDFSIKIMKDILHEGLSTMPCKCRATEHLMPVNDVRYTQNCISPVFGSGCEAGKPLESLIQQFREGTVEATSFTLKCAKFHGKVFSLNNRRLYCLKEFQRTCNEVVMTNVVINQLDSLTVQFISSFSTSDDGLTIEILQKIDAPATTT